MTQERDIDRILDHWFSDGPTVAPDRVIDVVADRIGRESQRPAWRLDWRHPHMNTTFKLATAVAAVVIVAILGYNLLPGRSAGIGGGPTPSPTATPTPIPLPTGDATLGAGTYVRDFAASPESGLPSTFPKFIVTLPDGWSSSSNGPDAVFRKEDGDAVKMLLRPNPFLPADMVYGQPCQWIGTEIDPGPTVDGLASILATIPLRNATTPVDVTVDGYRGKYLEWSVPDDVDVTDGVAAACDKDQDGFGRFMSWSGRWQQAPGQVDRLWILDVGGTRFVLDAWFAKETTPADRAELTQIMDSVRFEP